MVSPENTNWLYEIGLIEDVTVAVPDANFSGSAYGFGWSAQNLTGSSGVSLEMEGSLGDSERHKETGSKKRSRPEASAAAPSSKACREKQRRDRLNDKFTELAAVVEPGKPPKMDKSAILVDAIRMVAHLKGEAQKLKDSKADLQERIKELKAEKIELRDEKQRLKAEKETLESQLKKMNAEPNWAAAGGNKLVPIISYNPAGVGVAMWQFMPPASVDTSQDHVLRPPVA